MNIIPKITLKSLKQNKTRTLVTIIGIILSASMICAVTTFAETMRVSLIESTIDMNGNYYAMAKGISPDKISELRKDKRIEQISAIYEIGHAEFKPESQKPYYRIFGVNKDFFENMPIHLSEGRYPQNDSEIVISDEIAILSPSEIKIGDTLSLDIGDRTLAGNPIDSEESFFEKESLSPQTHKEYTVVGIFRNVYSYNVDYIENMHGNPSLPVYTLDESAESYDIFLKTHKPRQIFSFSEDNKLDVKYAHRMLAFYGASNYENFQSLFYGVIAFVIAIIIFGSVALIYNAFSISVSERTQQFGLLSSVGATKKQIRYSVLFEAFFVSIVGIPIGILCGIGGIGATIAVIRSTFKETLGFSFFSLRVSWFSVISACLIAAVTVLISAWIPSRRATKYTAIEAIRQSGDIKAGKKPIKVSKLTQKLFGFEGTLAAKYFKRNRKRYRSTILSLFMSVVLFISASSFTYYFIDAAGTMNQHVHYDIRIDQYNEDTDMQKLFEQTKNAECVTECEYRYAAYPTIKADSSTFAKSYKDALKSICGSDEDLQTGTVAILFVDDASFGRMLYENNLNPEKFSNPEKPLGVVYNQTALYNEKQHKFYTTKYFDENLSELNAFTPKSREGCYSYISAEDDGSYYVVYGNQETGEKVARVDFEENVIKHTLNIGGYIYEKTLSVSPYDTSPSIIYPISAVHKVLSEDFLANISDEESIYFLSSDSRKSTAAIMEIIEKNKLADQDIGVIDFAGMEREQRSLSMVVNIFAYGFIILISLIAAANVFNTITTNINLRRREFAMLKTVGMTSKGFNKMMNLECIMYGTRALLFGLPVSFLMTYWIYKVTSNGVDMTFVIPWKAVAIAVLSVFLVVFATMMYSMSKIKKENTIDALKNENL